MAFDRNVFINCPFDDQYLPLLRSLIFCLLYLKLEPKFSETKSSSDIRIDKIKDLIKVSKYGIHDLSRSSPLASGEYPRFNMPLELGLDLGCKAFGGRKYAHKKTLILDSIKHTYDIYIGDISGQDIAIHNNEPEIVIQKIRNWFSILNKKDEILSGPREIWLAYNQFTEDLEKELIKSHSKKDIEQMPLTDFVKYAKTWIKAHESK